MLAVLHEAHSSARSARCCAVAAWGLWDHVGLLLTTCWLQEQTNRRWAQDADWVCSVLCCAVTPSLCAVLPLTPLATPNTVHCIWVQAQVYSAASPSVVSVLLPKADLQVCSSSKVLMEIRYTSRE